MEEGAVEGYLYQQSRDENGWTTGETRVEYCWRWKEQLKGIFTNSHVTRMAGQLEGHVCNTAGGGSSRLWSNHGRFY
jgi:hypothetical protein